MEPSDLSSVNEETFGIDIPINDPQVKEVTTNAAVVTKTNTTGPGMSELRQKSL